MTGTRRPMLASISLLLGGASVVVGSIAQPSSAVAEPADMPMFDPASAASFIAEASALPQELRSAIERDTSLSPAEYLASADAASQAADVVEALRGETSVVDARIDGKRLIVWVEDERGARIAKSLGAEAIVGLPARPDLSSIRFEPAVELRGGAPYYYDSFRCTAGFAGVAPASGEAQLLTAGHCLGSPTSARVLGTMTAPNAAFRTEVASLGVPLANSYRAGSGWDHGLVRVTNSAVKSLPEVLTWGGGASGPLASPPLVVRDAVAPIAGSTLCKSGSTTGWTCGKILYMTEDLLVGDDATGYRADGAVACISVRQGDSGGPALVGSSAVGVTSATGQAGSLCDSSSSTVGFFTTLVSPYPGAESAQTLYGEAWEPLVGVASPVLTSPALGKGLISDSVVSGIVPAGSIRHSVLVSIDNGVPVKTPVSSTGNWSVAIGDLSPGPHSYELRASWGTSSRSQTVKGAWIDADVDRLAGQDRFATAVEVSKEAFPGYADVAFIATGLTYPDALAAGPVAAAAGGPLLLTDTAALPDIVRDELQRIRPRQIVVVGGPDRVSEAVVAQLSRLASDPTAPVVRVSGSSRYETSRLVAARAFSSAEHAYVVTGDNYADALGASAAAAASRVPVILVAGSAPKADQATLDYLAELGVRRIIIAGGTPSVSAGIATSLSSIAPVTRLSGSDRLGTSVAINSDAYSKADSAYIAFANNFPDALVGNVLAGMAGGPMYITPKDCVPSATFDHMVALGISKVTIFGGLPSIGAPVESLKRC